MPAYDYQCPDCDFIQEVIHGMSESPYCKCPTCGVPMRRVYTSFNMQRGQTRIKQMLADRGARNADMKEELKHDYGVEQVVPIRAGSIKEVYNDVKSQGSLVKDQMQENTEKSNAKRAAKQVEWKKGAMKRAPKRSQELVARKEKEAAAKRAVKL